MVSKSVLFALTLVALVTGGHSASTNTGVNACVGAMQYVNTKLSLNLDLSGLISGVLNLVKSLVSEVLGLVNGLLGVVGGLLGGTKVISAPTNLNQALGLVQVGLYVNDCALRKNLGGLYDKYYLSQIYIYVCREALLDANIDISAFKWLQLDADFDLDVYLQALLNIKAQVKLTGLSALFANIETLVNTLLKNVDNLVSGLLGDVVSLAWNLIFGYSKACGYTKYQDGYTTVTTHYTTILKKYNCGTINYTYLTQGNYCSGCISS